MHDADDGAASPVCQQTLPPQRLSSATITLACTPLPHRRRAVQRQRARPSRHIVIEALDDAAPAVGDAACARLPAQEAEDRTHEYRDDGAAQGVIPGEQVPKSVRERQRTGIGDPRGDSARADPSGRAQWCRVARWPGLLGKSAVPARCGNIASDYASQTRSQSPRTALRPRLLEIRRIPDRRGPRGDRQSRDGSSQRSNDTSRTHLRG